MVFGRVAVSSLFLLTVIAIPIAVPETPAAVPAGDTALPALVSLLNDSDPSVRAAAFGDAVSVAGRVPVEAIPALAGHVDVDDFAREGLLAAGAPAAEALAAQLRSEKGNVRAAAGYVL